MRMRHNKAKGREKEPCMLRLRPRSGKNAKVVAGQLFIKEIRYMTCGSNQPFQQKHTSLE